MAESLGERFEDFEISQLTLDGLGKNNFVMPTDIQRLTLPWSLSGKDVVGAAKTGSGKTLALIIPILERLSNSCWSHSDGLGALIIVPTRELAFQIFDVLNKVGANHSLSAALLIGGTEYKYQMKRLSTINIIICTPGRLQQHLEENANFSVDQLQILVIDETDRILDMGFRAQMDAILDYLPKERQTLLFSATQTASVRDLARISVRKPKFVNAHEASAKVTPDQLSQGYCICEEEEKINFMWSFLTNHKVQKSIIFVSCCRQARFLTEAFHQLGPGVSISGLWGGQSQQKRLDTFNMFDNRPSGALICTDVASRGLDFKNVDWVLQMDCPLTVEDYIHRVGRTARMEQSGEAVLVLTPNQEEPFLNLLNSRRIRVERIFPDQKKMIDIKKNLMGLLSTFPTLKEFAQRSIVAYAKAIYFAKNKSLFDVSAINFSALAESYGLAMAPRIRFLKRKEEKSKSVGQIQPNKKRTLLEVLESERKAAKGEVETVKLDTEDQASDTSDDDMPFLKVSRRDVSNFDDAELKKPTEKPSKPITRGQIAKKFLKKNFSWSNRKVFNDDEDIASAVNDDKVTGFSVETAKKELEATFNEDKKAYREAQRDIRRAKRIKAKGRPVQADSDDELDLSEFNAI